MLSDYNTTVAFSMAAEAPGPNVPDAVHNALGYFIVSERLRNILRHNGIGAIEFLPIKIRNHKGRLCPEEFFVANVLDVIDCSDAAATHGSPNPLFPGQLLRIQDLALDAQRIPPNLNIFRLALRPRILIVRDDLRDELQRAAVTGLVYITPGPGVAL